MKLVKLAIAEKRAALCEITRQYGAGSCRMRPKYKVVSEPHDPPKLKAQHGKLYCTDHFPITL